MDCASYSWVWATEYHQPCLILESQTLWGETVCRVWLPDRDAVVRLPAARLRPVAEAATGTADGIAYVAAAARVADALTQDVLLAPIESSVIPLPHQIRALSRAISSDRVRYLLADEVGLGKTIVRIPAKSSTRSGANRPPIPEHRDHPGGGRSEATLDWKL